MLFKGKGDTLRYLAVGLGNPGLQYENTRHNAGFMAADILAEKISAGPVKNKFDAVYREGTAGDIRVVVCKPQTYMNLSGKAVVALAGFYKIPPERIIIISDDINLPVGNIRIRRKGSAGGHNGLKDIFELMGTEDIMRIRIGVGERKDRGSDLADHVLGKIPSDQAEEFSEALTNAADAVTDILKNGIDHAMNRYSK